MNLTRATIALTLAASALAEVEMTTATSMRIALAVAHELQNLVCPIVNAYAVLAALTTMMSQPLATKLIIF
jgi:hypothetical protein